MAEAARRGALLPEIQEIAAYSQDPLGLDAYLRRTWVYVPDPDNVEFVREPRLQLESAGVTGYFEGDCDDAATFAGSIALAMRWPCQLTAYRMAGKAEFRHVNLRCLTVDGSGQVFDVDPTVPAEHLPVMAEETLDLPL